jgi:hypothetical protein
VCANFRKSPECELRRYGVQGSSQQASAGGTMPVVQMDNPL